MLPLQQPIQRIRRVYHTGRYKKVKKWLQPGRLLDIGCGRPCESMPDGSFIRFLGYGTGLDMKPCEGSFDFVQGDITQLPFPNQSFESVVTMEILEHVPNAEKALSEIHRVLKDDGVLVVSLPEESWLWKIFWAFWEKTYGSFWRDTHTHTIHMKDWYVLFGRYFTLEAQRRHWHFDLIFRLRKKAVS